jgi:predicted amidohydrolase YtcJ
MARQLGLLVSVLAIGLAPIAATPLSRAQAAARSAPDYVIYNANVITVNPQFALAKAFAVADGKFLLVGDNASVLKTAGPNTKKIDLRGRTVVPGFSDTHVHLMSGQTLGTAVNLTNIHSIAEIQKAIATRVASVRPGEWIQGTRGWWEYELAEQRIPTRQDLDVVSPNNPVVIPGPHYSVANSLALKLAGITKDSKDPQGGEIRKDPVSGEPTGILFDNASRPIMRLIPKASRALRMEGVRKTLELVNSNGLTSIGEPSGGLEEVGMFRELYDAGQLTVRVDFSFNIDPALPAAEAEAQIKALGKPGSHDFGNGMFRSDELGEVGLDGAEQTGLMRNDYPDRPGYRGLQKVPQQQFNEFAAIAAKYGWRLRPHVQGDAAVDEAIEAFRYADQRTPIANRRWMLDHANLVGPDHYKEIKRLGLIVNSQYMHNAQLGALILRAWHRPLADRSEPFKEWLANGVLFTTGSDGPISYHAEPLYEIYGLVTRKTLWGGSLGPDQGISRAEAIKAVTINSAHTSFEENIKGSIEKGKYADFVLLSDDILSVPEDKIKDVKVLGTVLGGKVVFGALAP